jgi:thiamine pyrophosphate-dependent acetolactate synthase large subunit-like protein
MNTRSSIVKEIMGQINDDDILVTSTGYISREVYKVKDRPLNFYMMGSMGNALAIGIGIAMNVANRVIVINGDGSALMSLGTLATASILNPHNLLHFIIDNSCHESTGGQETASCAVDFRSLYANTIVYSAGMDNSIPPRIKLTPKQITERFRNALLRIKK